MAADCPIPENLVQAFREAAREFREWRKYNGPEPDVQLGDQLHSILEIAQLTSGFNEPMSEDILDLFWQIEGFGGNPVGKTFAAAGVYLSAVYADHRRLLANRRD
jgi:hypothetical protein